jgi:hypothetical protein
MADYNRVLRLLSDAIPEAEMEALHRRAQTSTNSCYTENGGLYYDDIVDTRSRVASWNNTRPSEKEIIEWFERALLLA